MEHLILKVLSFDVAVPTLNCFCERFIQEGGYDDKTKSLAMVNNALYRVVLTFFSVQLSKVYRDIG